MSNGPRVPGGNPADPFPIVNAALDVYAHQEVYAVDSTEAQLLTFYYLGGRWGGFPITDGSVSLTDNAENYVVVARATGVLSAATSTTNWNDLANYARAYHVTTLAGARSVTRDYRAGPGGVHGQAAPAAGGAVNGPGASTDMALARWDGTAGDTLQNSAILVTDDAEISGYRGNINRQTGTSYTLVAADSGKIVELANASAIALTADPALPKGFNCMIVQALAGQVTIASTGSGTVVNRQSHTKTAGLNAMVSLYVRSNSGTDAVFVLGGDTSA